MYMETINLLFCTWELRFPESFNFFLSSSTVLECIPSHGLFAISVSIIRSVIVSYGCVVGLRTFRHESLGCVEDICSPRPIDVLSNVTIAYSFLFGNESTLVEGKSMFHL